MDANAAAFSTLLCSSSAPVAQWLLTCAASFAGAAVVVLFCSSALATTTKHQVFVGICVSLSFAFAMRTFLSLRPAAACPTTIGEASAALTAWARGAEAWMSPCQDGGGSLSPTVDQLSRAACSLLFGGATEGWAVFAVSCVVATGISIVSPKASRDKTTASRGGGLGWLAASATATLLISSFAAGGGWWWWWWWWK
jgi:hypothetical protein